MRSPASRRGLQASYSRPSGVRLRLLLPICGHHGGSDDRSHVVEAGDETAGDGQADDGHTTGEQTVVAEGSAPATT
ncbi:hypothetical protein ACS0TY_011396 [Phlomoides rotata]